MASDRMSHKEWETLKVQEFERLEAENAALGLALAECRAALEQVRDETPPGQAQMNVLGTEYIAIGMHAYAGLLALLAEPPASAVTRAGELLAAADVLAAAAKHADLVGYYSQQRHNLPAGLVAPLERLFEAQQAYRRLRAGHGGG